MWGNRPHLPVWGHTTGFYLAFCGVTHETVRSHLWTDLGSPLE